MNNAEAPKLHRGADSAEEIYLAVGIALSWWEGSEDTLMGLFKLLVQNDEPVAIDAYIKSNRAGRGAMLRNALVRYERRLETASAEKILKAMKALDKLAPTRNEIAHGHCSRFKQTVNGTVVMEGHYLLPSFNEAGWHERSLRYTHTVESITAFRADVGEQHAILLNANMAIIQARQTAHLGRNVETQLVLSIVDGVRTGRIPETDVLAHLQRVQPGQ
ncbi:hypothetical protein [Bosea sp. 685]|uniref:hypothetical protein n=1 Tax=Bosea sp. 685 TaxID=3080057 RepID=UPI002892B501|nr:hypothetical protein [Bosea sp. 685]WNJ89186.1 hypothetical protein RMR04_22610 [Bosea sp. 685]